MSKAAELAEFGGGISNGPNAVEGLIKHFVVYDAVNQATRGSLNQSSLTDETTGRFHSSFTSSFGSATDKCAVTDLNNTTNDTASNIGETRGGIISNIGTSTNGTFRALSASEIQFYSNYG